jgi:hypothetical protein
MDYFWQIRPHAVNQPICWGFGEPLEIRTDQVKFEIRNT